MNCSGGLRRKRKHTRGAPSPLTSSKLMIPKSVQRLKARGSIKTKTELFLDGGRTCQVVKL
jgi:hypothetical protein